MTKFYCDICGIEVLNETDSTRRIQMTIKEVKFIGHSLISEERPFVMCEMCYSKFTSALMDKLNKYILEGDKE